MNKYVKVRFESRRKKLEKSIELARLWHESDCVISKFEQRLNALNTAEALLEDLDPYDDNQAN